MTSLNIEAPQLEFKKLVKEFSDAVSYIHDIGIVHRDLKPTNLLVQGEHLKVIDFGISMLYNGDDSSGDKSGTLPYQSSEAFDQKKLDFYVDWWSVGVISLECYTKRYLFGDIRTDNTIRDKNDVMIKQIRDFHAGVGNSVIADQIATVPDDMTKRLFLGLLAPYGERWDRDRINRWLNGENVPIGFRSDMLKDNGQTFDGAYKALPDGAFSINGHPDKLSDPEDIINLLQNNYPLCNELFTSSQNRERFRNWANGYSERVKSLIITQIDSFETPEYRSLILQRVLDPSKEKSGSLYYMGREISNNGFSDAIKKANKGDQAAIEWFINLIRDSILGTVDSLNKKDNLIQFQSIVNKWVEDSKQLVENKLANYSSYFGTKEQKYISRVSTQDLKESFINILLSNSNIKPEDKADKVINQLLKSLNFDQNAAIREPVKQLLDYVNSLSTGQTVHNYQKMLYLLFVFAIATDTEKAKSEYAEKLSKRIKKELNFAYYPNKNNRAQVQELFEGISASSKIPEIFVAEVLFVQVEVDINEHRDKVWAGLDENSPGFKKRERRWREKAELEYQDWKKRQEIAKIDQRVNYLLNSPIEGELYKAQQEIEDIRYDLKHKIRMPEIPNYSTVSFIERNNRISNILSSYKKNPIRRFTSKLHSLFTSRKGLE